MLRIKYSLYRNGRDNDNYDYFKEIKSDYIYGENICGFPISSSFV